MTSRRSDVFAENVDDLKATLDRSPDVAVVTTHREWRAARDAGKHAAAIAIPASASGSTATSRRRIRRAIAIDNRTRSSTAAARMRGPVALISAAA